MQFCGSVARVWSQDRKNQLLSLHRAADTWPTTRLEVYNKERKSYQWSLLAPATWFGTIETYDESIQLLLFFILLCLPSNLRKLTFSRLSTSHILHVRRRSVSGNAICMFWNISYHFDCIFHNKSNDVNFFSLPQSHRSTNSLAFNRWIPLGLQQI